MKRKREGDLESGRERRESRWIFGGEDGCVGEAWWAEREIVVER